jgi:hypothetical protein
VCIGPVAETFHADSEPEDESSREHDNANRLKESLEHRLFGLRLPLLRPFY